MAASEVVTDATTFNTSAVVPDATPFSTSAPDSIPFSSSESPIPRQASLASTDSVGFEDVQRASPLRRRLPCYDMSGDKILIIFNHFKYKRGLFRRVQSTRYGTHADVFSLENTFRGLGFMVVTHDDWKYEDIIQYLSRVCNSDHSHTSCLAVAVMTHGGRSLLWAADQAYHLSEITNMLGSAPGLQGKPKLFFVQACRAGHASRAQLSWPEKGIAVNKDCLLLQSCYDDYVSYRHVWDGSWLIQALCQMVDRHHEVLDLAEMVTLVNGAVAAETSEGFKQMPVPQLELTKTLML